MPNLVAESVHEPVPDDKVITHKVFLDSVTVTVPVGVPANSGETETDKRSARS